MASGWATGILLGPALDNGWYAPLALRRVIVAGVARRPPRIALSSKAVCRRSVSMTSRRLLKNPTFSSLALLSPWASFAARIIPNVPVKALENLCKSITVSGGDSARDRLSRRNAATAGEASEPSRLLRDGSINLACTLSEVRSSRLSLSCQLRRRLSG